MNYKRFNFGDSILLYLNATIPTPRMGAFSYFDPILQELTVFGGYGYGVGNSTSYSDLWTWTKVGGWVYKTGSLTPNESTIFEGPSATPGGRAYGALWKDASGIWLFGGEGTHNLFEVEIYGDLWLYNGGWVHINQTVSPSPRSRFAYTTDSLGNVWIVGGNTTDIILSDIWNFNGFWSETYSGASVSTQATYGPKYEESFGSYPGSTYASSVIFGANELWIYGGSTINGEYSHNLWRFSLSSFAFAWMGDDEFLQTNYSAIGVASSTNYPGTRVGYSWASPDGTMWLLSGSFDKGYNELWAFDGALWTFVSSGELNGTRIAPEGVFSAQNYPPMIAFGMITSSNNLTFIYGANFFNLALYELWTFNSVTKQWAWYEQQFPEISSGGLFVDANYHLYVYGGYSFGYNSNITGEFNDMWEWNGNSWSRIHGNGSINNPVYSAGVGVADELNNPGSRTFFSYWTDNCASFWLYGGWVLGELVDDIWRYAGGVWTQMAKGSNQGVYSSGSDAYPALRTSPLVSFNPSTNRATLFGGSHFNGGSLSDMWEWDGSKWLLVYGDDTLNKNASYDAVNTIGGTSNGVIWISNNKGYVYGGTGFARSRLVYGSLSDLWTFDLSSTPTTTICTLPGTTGTPTITQSTTSTISTPSSATTAFSFSPSTTDSGSATTTSVSSLSTTASVTSSSATSESSLSAPTSPGSPATTSPGSSLSATTAFVTSSSATTSPGTQTPDISVSIQAVSNPVNPRFVVIFGLIHSKRIVLKAISTASLFTWSVVEGEDILLGSNLEAGPTGSLLIIKKDVLHPRQRVVLKVTATK